MSFDSAPPTAPPCACVAGRFVSVSSSSASLSVKSRIPSESKESETLTRFSIDFGS